VTTASVFSSIRLLLPVGRARNVRHRHAVVDRLAAYRCQIALACELYDARRRSTASYDVTQNRAMKILSIRQPWEYSITRGSKNIENRSWPTNYRGPVLIHASLKIDKQPCADHGLDPTKLETGGVVGIKQATEEGPSASSRPQRRPQDARAHVIFSPMKPSVIVWDLETVPDLAGFAAANDLVGKSDVEVREAIGEKCR